MSVQEYYRQIRASLAVVPAFASDVYYTKKSSSSVAAAMVCGTPVLADHDLVRHYNYLSKVWPAADGVGLSGLGMRGMACMCIAWLACGMKTASCSAALMASAEGAG